MTGLLIPDGAPTVVGVNEPLPPRRKEAGRSPARRAGRVLGYAVMIIAAAALLPKNFGYDASRFWPPPALMITTYRNRSGRLNAVLIVAAPPAESPAIARSSGRAEVRKVFSTSGIRSPMKSCANA